MWWGRGYKEGRRNWEEEIGKSRSGRANEEEDIRKKKKMGRGNGEESIGKSKWGRGNEEEQSKRSIYEKFMRKFSFRRNDFWRED